MSNTIKDQLSTAIAARKDSLKELRARIMDLLDEVPVGVKLDDKQLCNAPVHTDNCACTGGLVVRVVRVCTGASQWSNRTWDVTIKGKGLLDSQGRLIAENLDESYWDGNNMHHHTTEPVCIYNSSFEATFGEVDSIAWASGKSTRDVATRLPEAIARYMAACEAERNANSSTLTA